MSHLFRRFFSFSFLILAAFTLIRCEKGSPVLDDSVILTISASPATILNFGDTAIITVRAFEPDGRPVLDGARIQLSAGKGSITPEVRTVNGLAEAVYVSDASTGTVTITAQSGSIGADGAVSIDIEVIDRETEISAAALNVNPSNLSDAGGVVDIRMAVLGPDGEALAGKPVVFSSNFGTLAGNGSPILTDSNGVAADELFLSQIPESISEVTVTGRVGTVEETATITITENQTPTPEILFSPENPRVGDTVFFSGETSSDADGDIVRYHWNFGDGESGEGHNVSHVFRQGKTYIVTLTVTDNLGAGASISEGVTVGENEAPVPAFTFSPSQPRVGDVIVFNASESQDPDGRILDYQWSMGNGAFREGKTITYAYAGAGTFSVILTVTDDGGETAVLVKEITITGNTLPVADFSFSPLTPGIDQQVVFDGAPSTDEDGNIISYEWNFGDGRTGTGPTVSHSFRQAGQFQVVLEIQDNNGGRAFAQKTVTVADNSPPDASFSYSPSNPRAGTAVVFDGTASSDNEGVITKYRWDFGDGTEGSGAVVQHIYRQSGSFTAALEVTDESGAQDVTAQVVTVSRGGVPVADFRIDPETIAPPGGTILLDGSATTDTEDLISELRFRFEAQAPDGVRVTIPSGNGPIRQATVTGLAAGQRVIFTMSVLDLDGNEAVASEVLTAAGNQSNVGPVARLTTDPTTSITAPSGDVLLDGSATTDADHDISELKFDFAAEAEEPIQVTISGTGPIRVARVENASPDDTITFRMTVSDPVGALDSKFALIRVTATAENQLPVPALVVSPSGTVELPNDPIPVISFSLDASGTTDAEDDLSEMTFSYEISSSLDGSEIFTQPNNNAPWFLIGRIENAQGGEIVQFTLTVTDSDGGKASIARSLVIVDNQ